jgi:polycystin 1L2
LGHLSYLHIWHDNSGKSNWGSWFLEYVIVNDLQTKTKTYFICQKWLGVDKDDGMIERMIPVSGEMQKREFSYLLAKEGTRSIRDGHLWLSIFTKPVYSAFSRVERITCCFALLYISMMMNIVYYGYDNELNTDCMVIGPFYVSKKQV